jgi:isocitrate/isopropylmalate dehydrogenase
MMLRHLGEQSAASAVEAAVDSVLRGGTARTGDLGGSSSTEEVTEAIVAALPG